MIDVDLRKTFILFTDVVVAAVKAPPALSTRFNFAEITTEFTIVRVG